MGNQIMRIMSLMGMAKRYNTTWAIPQWPYEDYFENEFPKVKHPVAINAFVKEPHFHYAGYFFDKLNWKQVIDVDGFLQSPKYWYELLKFRKEILESIKLVFDFNTKPIAVSVRRGDFIGHRCYVQLPVEYYTGAVQKHFPDYKERGVFVFSDDIQFCRENFQVFENVMFIDEQPIIQLAVMNLCADFVISNSTFSYVGAYLAQRGSVIRPIKNFDGEYAKKHSEKDFWPGMPNWIPFDHTKELQCKE